MSALAGIPSPTASATKVTKGQENFNVGKIDVNAADSWRFRQVVCGQGLNCSSFFKLRRVATTKHTAYLSDDLASITSQTKYTSLKILPSWFTYLCHQRLFFSIFVTFLQKFGSLMPYTAQSIAAIALLCRLCDTTLMFLHPWFRDVKSLLYGTLEAKAYYSTEKFIAKRTSCEHRFPHAEGMSSSSAVPCISTTQRNLAIGACPLDRRKQQRLRGQGQLRRLSALFYTSFFAFVCLRTANADSPTSLSIDSNDATVGPRGLWLDRGVAMLTSMT